MQLKFLEQFFSKNFSERLLSYQSRRVTLARPNRFSSLLDKFHLSRFYKRFLMLSSLKKSRNTFLFSQIIILGGCSFFPANGPSRMAMEEAGSSSLPGPKKTIVLVEINDYTLGVLARRPVGSLRGIFGDRRTPTSQPIGVGDSLQITIWEAAAGGLFSQQTTDQMSPGSRTATIPIQVVARDGTISVPYAGRVQAAGRTTQQVEGAIIANLQGKAIEPQVLVNLTQNVTNTVTVTGEVTNGARVPLTLHGDRILDVIASAGGYRSPSHETFVSLTRGNKTAKAPIQLLTDTPSENVYVHPGDILTVERAPQTFTVVGATGTNDVVPFGVSKLSLEEAIGRAGGAQDGRADPDGVFLLRYEPSYLVRSFPGASPELLKKEYVPTAYHVSLRDPEAYFLARRFDMRDKDILLVTNAPLTEISKLTQLFSVVTQPAMAGRMVMP